MKTKRSQIGKRIKEARLMNSLTQKELAKKCGINQHEVSRYETGKFIPNVRSLEKLAKALEIEMVFFLS